MKVRILQFSTTFTQVYTRPKKNLLGSSLAFTLKEGPVRCAKVCNKSWVILTYVFLKQKSTPYSCLLLWTTQRTLRFLLYLLVLLCVLVLSQYIYRMRAIISRSRFEAALVYKPRILSLKNEEFPVLVHKLSAI